MTPIVITNKGRILRVYSRDKDGKKIVKEVNDFCPYFYVEAEDGKFTTIDGKKVELKCVYGPSEVPKWREKFIKEGKETYEADVVYTVRFAIDRIPAPWPKTPLRYAFIDIEAKDSLDYKNTPQPIVAITVYDSFDNKFYTFVLSDKKRVFRNSSGVIVTFTDETDIINQFISYIKFKDPDLLLAWNVTYDINYLINRMRYLGYDPKVLSPEGRITFNDGTLREIKGRAVVDYLRLFQGLEKLESYSLDNVAEALNLPVRKVKKKPISQMSWKELALYNRRDVEILKAIEDLMHVIEFYDELRRLIGIPWNYLYDLNIGLSVKRIVDAYILRKAKKKGIVLPTAKNHEKTAITGGYVLEPPAGIFQNVVVFDIKSMYPNIVRTYNLSFETLSEDGEIITPLGYRFVKEPMGLIPEFVHELIELRQTYKKKMKEAETEEERKEYDNKQTAIKIILNAGSYGVLDYPGFRLFRKEVAESITAFGRELLKHVFSVCQREGYRILYGDTDSVFVKFPDNLTPEQILEEAKNLQAIINESFDEFARQWGVDKHYHEIEINYIFKRVAFFGIKKRYAGYYIYKDDKWDEGIVKKGLEIVRSDTAMITKITFEAILNMLLKEGKSVEDVIDFIAEQKRKVALGQIPIEDLVFKVNFDPNKEYKNKNIPHLRGLRFAMELGIIDTPPCEKLVWIYIRDPRSNVIAVPESKIDVLKQFIPDLEKNNERYFGNIEKTLKALFPRMKLDNLIE